MTHQIRLKSDTHSFILLLVPYQPKTCQKKQENFHTGLDIGI